MKTLAHHHFVAERAKAPLSLFLVVGYVALSVFAAAEWSSLAARITGESFPSASQAATAWDTPE
jgi:hypothetical protein